MNRSLTRNALFNMIYSILNMLFPLISAAYIARVLTPGGIGKTAYAQNIASYFVVLAAMGIPQYGIREIARCGEDRHRTEKLFSELFVLNGLSSILFSGLYLIFVFWIFPQEKGLYLAVGLEILMNIFRVDWFYQGKEDYGYITARSLVIKLLSLVCLFSFVREEKDYIAYGLILCFGTCGNHLLNMLQLRTQVKITFQGLNLWQHGKPVLLLMLVPVIAALYSKVDITMLGWLSGDTAVGYYSMANKVVMLVLALATSLTAVLLPRLSYVYARDRDAFQRYLDRGVKLMLLLCVPCCCGLAVVAEKTVQVFFGPDFRTSAGIIGILCALIPIRGIGDLLCYQAVISADREERLIGSRIAGGLANILLNIILIPDHGAAGAAVATVISELIVNGILLKESRKLVKVRLSSRFLVSLVFSALIMILTVWTVETLAGEGLASLMMMVLSGVIVYVLCMILLKNDMVMELLSKRKKPHFGSVDNR